MTYLPRIFLRARATACILAISASALVALPLQAQPATEPAQQPSIQQLQQQIIEIQRESERKLQQLRQQTDQQLQQLQAQIAQLASQAPAAATAAASSQPASNPQVAEAASAAGEHGTAANRLKLSGDFRVRYEYNSDYQATPSWDRGVLRGRVAASYQLTDRITLGTRVVTGDPDDPRTTDTTLSSFVNKFDISLDKAYVDYRTDRLLLTGGKFAKPFSSTELVWDGDVNPQGVGGYYDLFRNDSSAVRVSGTYFLINENTLADSSDMLGGQLSWSAHPAANWDVSLHSAYYDYDIGTLNPSVPGGARGNNINPGGLSYVSDFNLWDTMAKVAYNGFGDRWNVRFVADYVKNLGAEVDEDSGYGFDLFVGNLNAPGHFLFRYGYSQVETDAVLGMFSHDNIILPTNYQLHTFTVDYALMDHAFIGLTHYEFRQLDEFAENPLLNDDWASRTRLNLYFTF